MSVFALILAAAIWTAVAVLGAITLAKVTRYRDVLEDEDHRPRVDVDRPAP